MGPAQIFFVMLFGALIAAAGIALFYIGKGSGQNRLILFGQTFEVSTPALVIVILGCGVFVMPALLPLREKTESPEKGVVDKRTVPELVHGPRVRQTTTEGVSAKLTEFSFKDDIATLRVMFSNTTDHDVDFCTRPDAWKIIDNSNPAACGWPLLASGGDAICDTDGWHQMQPRGSLSAWARMRCPSGHNDIWSFYSPDFKQMVDGLRF
jgi:hypothetical protein